MENKESIKNRERQLMDHEGRLQELSNSIKPNNTWIIGVPGDRVRERDRRFLFNILQIRSSLSWGRKQAFQYNRHRKPPLKINKNKSTSQHIVVKHANFKDKMKILKVPWDKRS